MTSELVDTRIKAILSDILTDPALVAQITATTSIVMDLGLDSIQMINFLLRLEDEFDLELDFEELTFDQINSMQQLCAFITGQIPEPPA